MLLNHYKSHPNINSIHIITTNTITHIIGAVDIYYTFIDIRNVFNRLFNNLAYM